MGVGGGALGGEDKASPREGSGSRGEDLVDNGVVSLISQRK